MSGEFGWGGITQHTWKLFRTQTLFRILFVLSAARRKHNRSQKIRNNRVWTEEELCFQFYISRFRNGLEPRPTRQAVGINHDFS